MLKLQVQLFLIFIIITMNTQGQNSYIPPFFVDNNRLEKMQHIFPEISKMYAEYAEKNHISGYAFGIMVDGQLIFSGAGGYINLEKKTKATTHSMFRIASMTKSFTAMAIIKLRDDGKLRLDDPVDLYIPELKNQHLTQDAPVMTIRNLLVHSAGFPQDDPWGDRQLSMTKDELINLINNKLSFASTTGTAFEYSNLAYAILGLIIDKASGISYQDYIAKNIWHPLGMSEAAWDFTSISSNQLVHGYKWLNDGWTEEKLLHDGAFGAMGGMICSIEAFSRYVALHQLAWPARDDAETAPIKRSSIREMQQAWQFSELDTHYKLLNGDECTMVAAYGYGLRWFRDCDGKTFVGHSGGLPGFGSNWFIIPEYGIGVILLANNTYAPSYDINIQVLNTLVKKADLSARQIPVSKILKERQTALIKLLPEWEGAESSGIFADNFFLDFSLETRKKEAHDIFQKAGKIKQIGELVPENQLRGYFLMEGDMAKVKISFTLSPEPLPLIQEYQIELH